MIGFIKKTFFVLLCICLSTQANYNPIKEDVESHLNEFSHFNSYQHDNIDDNVQHSHTHKHSEDGEEHEHHHDHAQIAQVEIKVINSAYSLKVSNRVVDTTHNFTYKGMNSVAHPFEIFRPPIA